VGPYRLLARIGEGGMGVVHVAQGPDGNRVALKVLRPHVVGDTEGRERLAREVSSLRKVRSRHVAEILDADPHGDAPFIVTRYVPGLSLHDAVREEGPFTPADVAYAARHLLDAVRDVHAADVLHRDIKPTNVVMEGRAPILIDFGLARLAEDPRLTATGWLLGSPGYLAPEVLFGDDATAATDVHGWAATIVHAATGRSPYGRGHTMTILDRTRRGEIDLRGVPDPLRRLLAQCLALEALDRPTVREVADELDSFDADALATTALPVEPRDQAEPPVSAPAPPTQPWQLAGRDAPGPDSPTRVVASDPPTEMTPPPTRIAPVSRPVAPPVVQPVSPASPPVGTRISSPVAPIRPVAGPPVTPAVSPPARTVGAPLPTLATSPTLQQWPKQQPPTALRPVPQLTPLPPWGQVPLTRWVRFRRSLLLLGTAALVVLSFRAAPYLSLAALSVVVLVTRGLSRSGDALRRRRTVRGTRWHDTPRSVLAYPWHLLRGAFGSLVLLLCAVAVSATVVAVAAVLGLATSAALLAGGVALVPLVWRGPASARVRLPLTRAATRIARNPVLTTAVLGVIAVGLVVAVTSFQQSGISWAPDTGPPWRDVPFSLAWALGRA